MLKMTRVYFRVLHGESRLVYGEKFIPYVDAKIKVRIVKTCSHDVLLHDHMQELFMLKLDVLLEAAIENLIHTIFPNRVFHMYQNSYVRIFIFRHSYCLSLLSRAYLLLLLTVFIPR